MKQLLGSQNDMATIRLHLRHDKKDTEIPFPPQMINQTGGLIDG